MHLQHVFETFRDVTEKSSLISTPGYDVLHPYEWAATTCRHSHEDDMRVAVLKSFTNTYDESFSGEVTDRC